MLNHRSWRSYLAPSFFGLAVVVGLLMLRGLRLEVDGSGMRPIFSFDDPDARFEALEHSRQQQRSASSASTATASPESIPNLPPARSGPPVATSAAASPSVSGAAGAPVPIQGTRGTHTPGVPDPRRLIDAAANVTAVPDAHPRGTSLGSWSDFRGPRRDGRYEQTPIRTNWPAEGLPRLWRQPIGGGYASFTAAEGRAFTIEQRRDQEVVAAYDVETGRELWTHPWDAYFTEAMGGDGPRATPTWHGGRVYALGATGEFRALDAATGTLIWRRNILKDAGTANLHWAMAGSPLIVDEKVIVQPGGSPGRSVVAYHKLTGEPIWSALDDVQAYTSPMLVTLGGIRQVLAVTASRVVGLGAEDGTLLWEYPWVIPTVPNIAQPIELGNDRLFLSASYGHGAAVIELSRTGDTFRVETVWRNTRMKNKFSSSVLHDGYIYGLDDAILACIDPRTGELKWKGGRYGYGQLLLAGGHLIVLTERGALVLARATPERHEELARFSAIEGKTWNVPAIVGGRLLVRNAHEMAAFELTQ
jgi:outer membrane protein assembly factor BamB